MNNSEEIFKTLEASSFNKFIEEVNTWKSLNLREDGKNMKEFLNTLLLKNKEINELPNNDEILQIHKELVFEGIFYENRLKTKKKWSIKEKRLMVWALYYYIQIFNKKVEEMVRFHK